MATKTLCNTIDHLVSQCVCIYKLKTITQLLQPNLSSKNNALYNKLKRSHTKNSVYIILISHIAIGHEISTKIDSLPFQLKWKELFSQK